MKGGGKEMKRRIVTIAAAVLVLTTVFGSVSVSAAENKAVVTIYKAANNLSLSLRDKDEGAINGVYKVTFSYKGKESLSKFEKLLKCFTLTKMNPRSVNWESSNESIATVNSSGKVRAKAKGTCYIYPIPKNVFLYRYKGRFIWYLPGKLGGGLKAYGGFASKVTVRK